MAQITKGVTYSSGDSVTAQKLNDHVDLAVLQDGAITDQILAGSPSAGDKLLVSQSNALRQISWQSLCATPQAIGSTTPSTVAATSATVSGTLTVGGITTINNNADIDGAVTINDSGADKDTRIEGDTDANLVFVDASADKVGIGNNNPSVKLDVTGAINASGAITAGATATITTGLVANESGADSDSRIEGDTDANLVFVDASTDRVGIGTSTPSVKLDVSGDAKISGLINCAAAVRAFCKFGVNSSGVPSPDANVKFNVSSMSEVSAGNYKIIFTTPLPTANNMVIGVARDSSNSDFGTLVTESSTTNDITFSFRVNSGGAVYSGAATAGQVLVLGIA